MSNAARKQRAGKTGRHAPDVPGFQTNVNRTAGRAAEGIRVGFPASRTVSMTYVDRLSMVSTAGSLEKYQFRLNSAFDPNYTAAGHQPLGFDQWAQFYNHYVVEEVAYDIVICNATTSMPMVYGAHISDDHVVPSYAYALAELGATTTMVAVNQPAHIFKGKVDIARFFNRGPGGIANDPDMRASVGANPAEVAFLTLFSTPGDGVSGPTATFLIKLTYKVRFMEPKDLSPSLRIKELSGLLHPELPSDESKLAPASAPALAPLYVATPDGFVLVAKSAP